MSPTKFDDDGKASELYVAVLSIHSIVLNFLTFCRIGYQPPLHVYVGDFAA